MFRVYEDDGWSFYPSSEMGDPFPKPDYDDPRLKACSSCGSEKVLIKCKKLANGSVQFKAYCTLCGVKSGALPYAKDFESLKRMIIPYGKHKGKTLWDVYLSDKGYFEWALGNLNDAKLIGSMHMLKRQAEHG